MLRELRFVQGAVAKKDFVPAMKHFAIEDGHVRAYNGVLALSSPIDFNIDCKPKAIPLVKAIGNCNETIQLSMTDAGRLRVQSGSFRAFIECDHEQETPHVMPSGTEMEVDGERLLEAFRVVEPFIGDDASRQFTNGVLLSGCSAFATCNVIAVEYWVGSQFPRTVNVPRVAINEILRINEPFSHIQLDENSITFHYSDGRWIRSSLFSDQWPPVSEVISAQCNLQPLDDRIFEGLEKLKDFTDKMKRIFFEDGAIVTHQEQNEGGAFSIPGFNHKGIYNLEMLSLLKGVVTHIDWSAYPAPCMFRGSGLRGAIVGMK